MRRRRTPPGAPPGTLISDPRALASKIRVIAYGSESLEEREVREVSELRALAGAWPITWVNVDGLGDVDLLRGLGEIFGLHSLALEDVVNTHQRPKVEIYDDHAFIVTRMSSLETGPLSEQISMFLGRDFLITFQERAGDCFDPVRDRLRTGRGQIRLRKPDYLAYALIDAVVDACFPVLESYGERLEALEETVVTRAESTDIADVHAMKRDLLMLRRSVWPQREMVNALLRDDTGVVSDEARPYFRDCYDHTVQLMDVLETYREIASGLVDIYLSAASTRMNEIMKVLTVIATIFIPLSFIASLYGMNFDPSVSPWNMPELRWRFGYPFALGIMAAVAGGLGLYFLRRGWISRRRGRGG